MALFKNAVGEKLYVWTQTKGSPSRKIAIISAHGGNAIINGMTNVPTCELVYYCPHGQPVNDPSIERIISRQIVSYQRITSTGATQDYELSKYTNTDAKGTHNAAGETYTTVGSIDATFARRAADAQVSVDKFRNTDTSKYSPKLHQTHMAGQRSFETDVQRYQDLRMDVITIRNRARKSNPTLSWVLTQLWKFNYKYDEIHCSFCRGGGAAYTPQVVNDGFTD